DVANDILRDVRQVFLQIRIGRADDDRRWRGWITGVMGCWVGSRVNLCTVQRFNEISHLPHDVDLPRHADQRVFRRLVTVAGRIGGRPLDVRIVVGRTGAEVENFHAQSRAQLRKLEGLGEIIFDGIVLAYAKAIAVGQAVGESFRYAGTGFTGLRQRRIGLERHEIEGAQAHADFDPISARANARDNFAEDARAVLERSAEPARPRARAEKLVQQVAVAMFDIDKVGANIPGNLCRGDVTLDEMLDFAIGEHLRVARDGEPVVE